MPTAKLALLLVPLLLPSAAANPAVEPVPREHFGADRRSWPERHAEYVAEARRGGIDVLFLGDSITDLWRSVGRAVWDRRLAPLRSANFGLDGDRTQHLLWRLRHGELEGLSPRVVVILIGTGNLMVQHGTGLPRNSVPETIAGITAVVDTVQEKLPRAQVLLLGLLPRNAPESPYRREVAEINRALGALRRDRLHFLDIGASFLEADGTLPVALMPDLLHPSEAGYAVWAEAIAGPLDRLRALAEAESGGGTAAGR
ncbi:MAG: GDSL family lipase [Opitutaceae bacterium]|nr:GDSL family lipase [Opitutaceae bacterium]